MSCPDPRRQDLRLPVSCLRSSNRNGFRYFFRAAMFLGVLVVGGGNAWAQTWISAVSATITASTARVTSATACRPGRSQGRDPLGRIERFDRRDDLLRSSDATGALVVGPDYSLTISMPVTVSLSPQSATIAANGTQHLTAAVSNDPNQTVFWSATAGTVSTSGLF